MSYSLSGITIPASQTYDEDFPTRNQENLAKALLDCLAAQKASDQNTVYVDEDFYIANHQFDASTLSNFISQSNTISSEIQTNQNVITDLMDIGAGLIPIQFRWIYYLVKPILVGQAENLLNSLPGGSGTGTIDDVVEQLELVVEHLQAIDGRLNHTVSGTSWDVAKSLYNALVAKEEENPQGYIQQIRDIFYQAFGESQGSVFWDLFTDQTAVPYPKNIPDLLKAALVRVDGEGTYTNWLELLIQQPVEIRINHLGEIEDVFWDTNLDE